MCVNCRLWDRDVSSVGWCWVWLSAQYMYVFTSRHGCQGVRRGLLLMLWCSFLHSVHFQQNLISKTQQVTVTGRVTLHVNCQLLLVSAPKVAIFREFNTSDPINNGIFVICSLGLKWTCKFPVHMAVCNMHIILSVMMMLVIVVVRMMMVTDCK
jgi:hypothetical protein